MATIEPLKLDVSAIDLQEPFDINSLSLGKLIGWTSLAAVVFIIAVLVPYGSVVGLLAVAIVGILLYIKLFNTKGKKLSDCLHEFANANKFSYTEAPTMSPDLLPGSLFGIGHDREFHHQISGELNDLPFSLYQYDYETSQGRSSNHYNITVMEITLPRKLPHMVIDSLVESGELGSSTLPINFQKSQRIELEGNFSQYFALYAPDTYAIDALTLLAPDVMQTLMYFATLCDIEIIDDRVYFYWSGNQVNQKVINDRFQTVHAVLAETKKTLLHGDISVRTVSSKVATQATSDGSRLKTTWRPQVTAFAVVWVTIMLISALAPSSSSFGFYAGFGLMVAFAIAAVVNAFVREQQRIKLLRRVESSNQESKKV